MGHFFNFLSHLVWVLLIYRLVFLPLQHDVLHHTLHEGYVYVILLAGQAGYERVVTVVFELLSAPPELGYVLEGYGGIDVIDLLVEGPQIQNLC